MMCPESQCPYGLGTTSVILIVLELKKDELFLTFYMNYSIIPSFSDWNSANYTSTVPPSYTSSFDAVTTAALDIPEATRTDIVIDEHHDSDPVPTSLYRRPGIHVPPIRTYDLIMHHEGVSRSVIPASRANETYPGNWVFELLNKYEYNTTLGDESYYVTCYCAIYYRCACDRIRDIDFVINIPARRSVVLKDSVNSRRVVINGTLGEDEEILNSSAQLSSRSISLALSTLLVLTLLY